MTPARPRKISKKVDKPMGGCRKGLQGEAVARSHRPRSPKPKRSQVEKSLWDEYWIHEFRGRANLNQEKYAEAAKELEIGLASALHADAADKPWRTKMLLQIAYRSKEYPKVIELRQQVPRDRTRILKSPLYVGKAYYADRGLPEHAHA